MNPKLSKLFYFVFHNYIKRDQKLANLAYFRRLQWASEGEIKWYQQEKLRWLLIHAYKKSPYYRTVMNGIGFCPTRFDTFETIAKMPFLTKDIIRERLGEIVCIGVNEKFVRKNSTSGSTGEATYFLSDRRSEPIRGPLCLRSYEWAGIGIGDRELRLWGAPFDVKKANLQGERIKRFFNNQAILSAYDMSTEGMDQIIRFIESFRPHFIFSYPSSLMYMIEHIDRSNQAIDGLKLKAVMTSGEQLYKWQRKEIWRVFKAPVINFYGCREVGIIAQECDRQTALHVIPESVFLEVVDQNGNSVVGEEGDIVVTDLCNHVAPFIRYRIGDRGIILKNKCPCGRGGLKLLQVQGRSFDIIRSPFGDAVGGTFWTLLFRTRPGVKKFQVVQKSIDHIRVDYISESEQGLSDESTQYFLNRIKEKLEGLQVDFCQVDAIPLPPSGKQQFVISKIGSRGKLRLDVKNEPV